MGTSVTHYVLLGAKFNYKEIKNNPNFDNWCEADDLDDNPYQNTFKDGIVIIVDGMNGEYVFIGKVLAKATERGGGLPITKCDISDVDKQDVQDYIRGRCGLTVRAELWVFSHWH